MYGRRGENDPRQLESLASNHAQSRNGAQRLLPQGYEEKGGEGGEDGDQDIRHGSRGSPADCFDQPGGAMHDCLCPVYSKNFQPIAYHHDMMMSRVELNPSRVKVGRII